MLKIDVIKFETQDVITTSIPDNPVETCGVCAPTDNPSLKCKCYYYHGSSVAHNPSCINGDDCKCRYSN